MSKTIPTEIPRTIDRVKNCHSAEELENEYSNNEKVMLAHRTLEDTDHPIDLSSSGTEKSTS